MLSNGSQSADLLLYYDFVLDCSEHKLLRRYLPYWLKADHCLKVRDLVQFQSKRKVGRERGHFSTREAGATEESDSLAKLLRKSELPEIWANIWLEYDRQSRDYVLSIRMNKEFYKFAMADLPQLHLEIGGDIEAKHMGWGTPNNGKRERQISSEVVSEKFKVRLNCLGRTRRDTPDTYDFSNSGRADLVRFSRHHEISRLLENFQTFLSFNVDVSVSWGDSIPIKVDSSSVLHQLFEQEETKDVTILVAGGKSVKCHRLILAANSPVLAAMVSPTSGMVESQTGQVTLGENSEKGISLLVQYLYGKEVHASDLDCDTALQLFQAAHLYQLTQLERAVGHLIRQKSMGWFTADVALELYFFVRNLNLEKFTALREHLISVMIKMPEKVRSCGRFTELESVEAQDLLWRLFDSKK